MWHDLFQYLGKHDGVIGSVLVFIAALFSCRVAFLKILDDRQARAEKREEDRAERERQEQKEREQAEAERERARNVKIVEEIAAVGLTDAMNTDALNRAIMEAVTAAVVIADENGRIEHWNDAACALFGWTEHEAVGRPVTLIVPEDLRGAHLAGLSRYRDAGQSRVMGQTVNLRGLHKNGRLLSVTLSLSEGRKADGTRFFLGLLFPIPPPPLE